MNKLGWKHTGSLAAALALAACGGGDDGDDTDTAITTSATSTDPTGGAEPDPEIRALCVAGYEAEARFSAWRCACMGGDPSDEAAITACVAADDRSPATIDCLCDVRALYPESLEFHTCYAPKVETFADCITPLACDDKSGPSQCSGPMGENINGCGSAGVRVDAHAAGACLGSETFKCASGDKVFIEMRCDGATQCADNSDEQGC